MSILSEEVHYY
jgi:hypothetical protein